MRNPLCVAAIAARRDLGATACRVPRRLSPFDRRVVRQRSQCSRAGSKKVLAAWPHTRATAGPCRLPQSSHAVGVTQVRGGGGGGDGAGGTISPQACSPIRFDDARLKPTIAARCWADLSCSTLMLRAIAASASIAASAASFAARMTGAGEQPGRERPHPRTPDPDPRVGSGHVPAADDRNDAGIRIDNRGDIARD